VWNSVREMRAESGLFSVYRTIPDKRPPHKRLAPLVAFLAPLLAVLAYLQSAWRLVNIRFTSAKTP